MQVNTVSAGPYTITVAGKQRPFSNDFTVVSAHVTKYNGQDEIAARVLCTASSKEPGREYFVQYSTAGVLQECSTLN